MPSAPSSKLETFPNPAPERDYVVHIEAPEFTCLCPLTGQPDFATLTLDYIPDRANLELKALKLYLWSYRDQGAFHEAVTNRMRDDLATAMQPTWMQVITEWKGRGGIHSRITATSGQVPPEWARG